jgi:NAD(P)-dependent dehydrogenase (short-subunit alcohol dehydrogenase family)
MSFSLRENDMNEFQGKVAIVTGGTSGIGRAAAVAYAREGARVVVAGRRAAEGEETVRLLRAQGGERFFVMTDVSKAVQVKELVERTLQKFGRLDIAFNNAGIEVRGAMEQPTDLRLVWAPKHHAKEPQARLATVFLNAPCSRL